MRYLKAGLATLAVLLVWVAIVAGGAVYGWWRSPLAPEDDPGAFMDAAVAMIDARQRGSVALVLIEDGAVFAEHYASIGAPVNGATLFPVASVSKWVAAWAVMKLVEDGRLDLDRPVSDYLTRWQLPPSRYDHSAVTARRLLSHTAGLTDALGFADYAAAETLPSLDESLARPRASSGRDAAIAVGREPGTEWAYSGGGYLILELLVEELSGTTFEAYVQRAILDPLGMTRSTYRYPGDLDNVVVSYDATGRAAPLYRYASSAATALASSADDLSRFVLAQLPDAVPGRPLRQATIAAMRRPHASALGQDLWGLGTILYAPTGDGDHVFGHDGGNEPAINATARINPRTGDGIVVLVTGSTSLASELGFHWVFWQTGLPDVFGVGREVERVMTVLLVGCGLILATAVVIALRRRRAALV